MMFQRFNWLLVVTLVFLGFVACDTPQLPGTPECPPGTLGPFKCTGPHCGSLSAGCLIGNDSTSYSFVSCELAGLLDVPAPTCNDLKMNGDETYMDCGGSCPLGCADTRPCLAASDCANGCCTTNNVCDGDVDEDGLCDTEDSEVNDLPAP